MVHEYGIWNFEREEKKRIEQNRTEYNIKR